MNSEVIPFGLFHQNLLSKIQYPVYDMKRGYIIQPEPGWNHVDTFFAIRPNFRPIPVGAQLVCAIHSTTPPYQLTDIQIIYNTYNGTLNGVYFITYIGPVPDTMPLYFWKKDDSNVFASFCIHPPQDTSPGKKCENISTSIKPNSPRVKTFFPKPDDIWQALDLSPIYVMHPKEFGDDYKDIKFICNNGTVMPFLKYYPNIFNLDMYNTSPKTLSECMVDCNIIGINGQRQPLGIIDLVNIAEGNKIQTRDLNSVSPKNNPNLKKDQIHTTEYISSNSKPKSCSNNLLLIVFFLVLLLLILFSIIFLRRIISTSS